MANIGILTFHRSNNTGAYIQCYALVSRLASDFPEHNFEVIDYGTCQGERKKSYRAIDYIVSNNMHSSYEGMRRMVEYIKNIIRLMIHPRLLQERMDENKLFVQARKNLPLSGKKLTSDLEDEFFKAFRNQYDVIIVGSDCVWQYFSYPFPNAYLLNSDICRVKISYAACAYRMDLQKMQDNDIKYLKNALSKFDYLGVRDIETEKMLEEIGLHGTHNCDPSILLDLKSLPVDSNNLKKKLISYGVDFNRKVIGIQVANSEIGKWISDMVDTLEYQIIAIRKDNKYAETFVKNLTPLEWAKIFSFFEFTVTDFFHGTLLSLLNGTIPIAVDTGYFDKGIESRMSDLLNRVGMKDYYYKLNRGEKPLNGLRKIITKIEKNEKRIDPNILFENERDSYRCFKRELTRLLENL